MWPRRQVAWVWLLMVACGGSGLEQAPLEDLLREAPSEDSAPDEVSVRCKRSPPPLGPAYLLKDIYPPPEDPLPGPFGGPAPTELVALRGSLLFSAFDFAAGSNALWRSDGTPESTVPVKHFAGSPARLIVVGIQLFFVGGLFEGHEAELWVSDGTPAGTRLVRNLAPDSGFSFLENFVAVGDTVFFVRIVRPSIIESGRQELWRSNGTFESTVLVKDLGPENLRLLEVEALGDRLFFSFEAPETGVELWVSDGTEASTHLVKDIFPGAESSFPRHMMPAGGVLYFSADDGEHGRELWRTDGTSRGTVLAEDTLRGSEGSQAQPFAEFNGRLYFTSAQPGFRALELRKLNPKTTGLSRSQRVAVIPNPFADIPFGSSIFVFSSTVTERQLFFTLFFDTGSPAPADTQLWSTDGTRRGTMMLARPLVVSPDLLPARPAPTDDGRVVFFAFDEAHGHEPWVSDGTPEGTQLLQDIMPGPGSSYPQDLLRAGDFIYFIANDGVHDREIWALPVPPCERRPQPPPRP